VSSFSRSKKRPGSNTVDSLQLWIKLKMKQQNRMGENKQHGFFGLDSLTFINYIEQGFLSEDPNGKIIFANQKLLDLLGYNLNELIGKDWFEIVMPDEQRKVKRKLRTRLKGVKNQFETELISKSNKRIPVLVCTQPIFQFERKPGEQNETEQYQGTISTFTDVTESKQVEHEIKSKSERLELMNRALNLQRKKLLELTEQLAKANEELKRLSKAKSDFVSAVSHDLRTPLTTIIEGISLVEDGTLGEVNEEQKKFLKLAIEDAERLNDFINDILDLAKIEAGKIITKKVRVSPKEMIRRIKTSYQNYAKEKGLEILIELTEPESYIFCDPGHYYRILTNFLSNAIKFTSNGGKIIIQVQPQKFDMVLTQVKDTGIGIPSEQKNHIFKKFEQIERSAHYLGSGLGLSLCKQLVELNDGKIGFESAVNKGSNFFFTLPIYDEIMDLNYILGVISQQAKTISGHIVIFLFKIKKEFAKYTDTNLALKTIAETIQSKTLTYDLLRIFYERQGVILVSALPEESAKPTFSELVKIIQRIDWKSAGSFDAIQGELLASFYVCPDAPLEARIVMQILENQLEPIT
jgi:PAS domain S-box-containing protein